MNVEPEPQPELELNLRAKRDPKKENAKGGLKNSNPNSKKPTKNTQKSLGAKKKQRAGRKETTSKKGKQRYKKKSLKGGRKKQKEGKKKANGKRNKKSQANGKKEEKRKQKIKEKKEKKEKTSVKDMKEAKTERRKSQSRQCTTTTISDECLTVRRQYQHYNHFIVTTAEQIKQTITAVRQCRLQCRPECHFKEIHFLERPGRDGLGERAC